MTTATEYLGHHDHALSSIELVRVLYFRVAVADHRAVCRRSTVRHMWSRVDELPANTEPSPRRLADLLASPTPATGAGPPSAEPLRAHASGLYAAEAAVELLVNHASWLRRGAFTSRFLHSAQGYPAMAYITWADAITALDSGQLPCSGGEGRILRLAALGRTWHSAAYAEPRIMPTRWASPLVMGLTWCGGRHKSPVSLRFAV